MRVYAILMVLLLIPVSVGEVTNGGSDPPSEDLLTVLLGLLINGEARMGRVDISLGESASRLMCRCLEDDSCPEWIEGVCDPLGTWAPEANRAFFTPLSEATSDPSAAICALGHYAFGIDPPAGTSRFARPDAHPADPLLSIEAVRWPDDDRYRYAIRYQLTADPDFDDYNSIRFTVSEGSRTGDVIALAGMAQVGSASDLPLAASFSSDDLYARACIRFATRPVGLPEEYCTRIIEVSP